jgi:hypothetical protein
MRNVRKLTALALATVGVLAFTSAPAFAGNGYENVTTTFGSGGSGPGQFKEPTSIAVNDTTEDVYVLDNGNDRIEYFSFNATTKVYEYKGQFNGSATPAKSFLKPDQIAVDQTTGDVYVADAGHDVIDRFSATGAYEAAGQLTGGCETAGEIPPSCNGYAPFNGLLEVATNPSGNVWVYEAEHAEVYEFTDASALEEKFATLEPSLVNGFAVDDSGNVYTVPADSGETKATVDEYERTTGSRIHRITPYEIIAGTASLAIIGANNDLLIDNASDIELYRPPFAEQSEPFQRFPAGGLSESAGIAVNGAKGEGTIYATQSGKDDVAVLDSEPAKAPEVVSESASTVEEVEEPPKGEFAAVIDPENRTTTYSFEYSETASTEPDGEKALTGTVKTVPGETPIPAEFGDKEVFSPPIRVANAKETIYYRVVVENELSNGKLTVGKVEAYTKIPVIAEGEEKFSELTSTSATLEATINPVFEETTYVFEYDESKAELENHKGIVIHGTTGAHQEQKLAELKKLEEQRAKEEAEGKIPPGTAPICPGIVEQGGTGTLPEVANKPCPVSAEISGLISGQTYYYRVVAQNPVTEYGNNADEGRPAAGKIKEFTPYAAPAIVTGGAQNITGTAATLSGEVDPEGTEATYYFAYIDKEGYEKAIKGDAQEQANPYAEGETTATNALPVGDHPVTVGPIPANDLLPGVTYHYALVSVNKYAIQTIGGDHTFTTGSATPPGVSTGGASGVSQNSATLSGTVTTNGLQTSYGFEIGTEPGDYGPATGLGSIGGAATETVSVALTRLQPGRTYYYRITATNADGTTPGNPEVFTTPGFPSLIAVPGSRSPLASLNIVFPKEEKAATSVRKLTNAEKLAKALKTCKQDKSKSKRTKCEAAAHKKYPVASKKKTKKK